MASAVTSSTLASVAVFLPLGLVGGQIGELFLPLAITVSIALLASLLVAVTIIPVLTSVFMKRRQDRRPPEPQGQDRPTTEAGQDADEGSHENDGRLVRLYTPALRFSLRHRGAVLLAALVVFVGGLGMASALPTEFLPPSEQRLLIADVELPSGTISGETSDQLEDFEDFMLDDDGVENYQLNIGGENANDPAAITVTNRAQAFIRLEEDVSISAVSDSLEEEGERLYGEDDFTLQDIASTGGSSGALSATLTDGSDEELAEASNLVEEELRDKSDLANVESDLSGGAPGVSVRVDPERSAAAGIPAEQVARSLGTYLAGNVAAGTAATPDMLSVGGTPVSVVIPPGEADSLEEIGSLPLGPGNAVSDVADVQRVEAPSEVRRSDGDRTVTVSATIEGTGTSAIAAEAQESLNDLELPGDVEASVGGESEDIQEGFRDLFVAIAVAVAIVYLILVIFFSSATVPLVILLAVPLTTAGAFGAQLLTGTALSVSSLLGVLLLIGIVVANSILLVDFAQHTRNRHDSLEDAILEAGQVRLRPILMTALATVFSPDAPRHRRRRGPVRHQRPGRARHRRARDLHAPHPPGRPGRLLPARRRQRLGAPPPGEAPPEATTGAHLPRRRPRRGRSGRQRFRSWSGRQRPPPRTGRWPLDHRGRSAEGSARRSRPGTGRGARVGRRRLVLRSTKLI